MLHERQTDIFKSYLLIINEFEVCWKNLSSSIKMGIHSVLLKDCPIILSVVVADNKGKGERCDCYLQEIGNTHTMTSMMWYGLIANILIESEIYVNLAICKDLETAQRTLWLLRQPGTSPISPVDNFVGQFSLFVLV